MRITARVEVLSLLNRLARERPVFHSEADFQHALAWEIQRSDPTLRVRLESRTTRGQRVDLLVIDPTTGDSTALELKYLCSALVIVVDKESFRLPAQGAQDIRGYDVIHDICRLESMVDSGEVSNGVMLVLTNDQSYWARPSHGRTTGASDFRLYEGETISGPRRWGPQSSRTAKQRDQELLVRGSYTFRWHDYSTLQSVKGGLFRWAGAAVEATP